MRIAFLLDSFPVISQTFVVSQICGLLDRGHDVRIIAGSEGPPAPNHSEISRYELLRRTRTVVTGRSRFVRGLSRLRLLPSLPARPGLLGALAPKYGSAFERVSLLTWAAALVKTEPVDVYVCHFGPVGLRAVALRELGVIDGPIATVFHGYDLSLRIRQRGEGYYAPLFESGDLFLPVTERWRHRLLELGCEPGRIAVHRMGIRLADFPFRTPRVEADPVRLVSVARLVEKKGLADALDAVADLVAEGRPLSWEIIGDGPLRPALERRIDELGVGGSVRLLGWRSNEEVRERLVSSDVLLAPSVVASDGDEEGLPVAIMEAMALGVLVVSTTHSGIPELVEDGITGMLAPERSPDDLADALRRLLAPEQWQRLAVQARRAVEERHNSDVLNGLLERHLLDLVRGRAPARATR